MEVSKLNTEQRNLFSKDIDKVSTLKMVEMINIEDNKVSLAVKSHLNEISKAIDAAGQKYMSGGRLIYIGAGTSGRLGVLDAVELIPTFGISRDRAIGLIAGGNEAMFNAVEGAEDNINLCELDLRKIKLEKNDVVIGLAASGRTPYVVGGLKYARSVGALSITVSCNENSIISKFADISIEIPVGPEVITGSTRMKAGTAEKMVLNMISTGIMIKNGKVYSNLMINVKATNEKLVDRGIRIIAQATNVNLETAQKTFKEANNEVNTAILMIKKGIDSEKSRKLIKEHNGLLSSKL